VYHLVLIHLGGTMAADRASFIDLIINDNGVTFGALKLSEIMAQGKTQEAVLARQDYLAHPAVRAASESDLFHIERWFTHAIETTKVIRGREMEYFLERYRQYGLDVETSVGPRPYSFSVTHHHDGVPYALYHNQAHVGQFDVSKVKHNMEHILPLIERHHDMIKSIYDYLKMKVEGDLWVLSGGGSQLQAFFTNKTGYLGILYLDMVNLSDQTRLSDSGLLKASGNESFTLVPNFDHNKTLFKNMKVPGVKVRRA